MKLMINRDILFQKDKGRVCMTKIDIFSGFLGAGKTTLIKKLISEAYVGEKLVLIENEFGEIGIDGGFMQEAGIEINEMNSGCICCSLVGDFTRSLQEVLDRYQPDRILIEPSGVGKLSDVIKAVQGVTSESVKLNAFTTVVDAGKCRVYAKNFGVFYNDQISNAGCIILSRTADVAHEKLDTALAIIRNLNEDASIITTPWSELSGEKILQAMERRSSLADELQHLKEDTCPVCGHHHHEEENHHHDHHHHDEDHHHHDEDHHHHDEDHHHHDEDHHHHDQEHHHHHDHHHCHDEECCCHAHDHDHHHHHADDVFDSWGVETPAVYTTDAIRQALNALEDEHLYGKVLRAKGMVCGEAGKWIHFDYVPGEINVREGGADVIGRLCVIGANIQKDALSKLFI